MCRTNVQLSRTIINMFGSLRQRVSRRRTSTSNKPPTLVVTEVSESESSTTPDPDSHETLKGRLQKKKNYGRRSLHIHAQEAGVRKRQRHAKLHLIRFACHTYQSAPSTLSGDFCFLWACCVRTTRFISGQMITELISQWERSSHILFFRHCLHTYR
jgi:hypothetical protein